MTGLAVDGLIGFHFSLIDDRLLDPETGRTGILDILKDEELPFQGKRYHFRKDDGSVKHVYIWGSMISGREGKFDGIVLCVSDEHMILDEEMKSEH